MEKFISGPNRFFLFFRSIIKIMKSITTQNKGIINTNNMDFPAGKVFRLFRNKVFTVI